MVWPFTSSPAPPHPDPAPSACPVDASTRAAWLEQNPSRPPPHASSPPTQRPLSKDRVVSSIPRWLPSSSPADPPADPTACPARSAPVADSPSSASTVPAASPIPSRENWVYPSPSSFFTALQRKDRNPDAADMPVVVPIHNAVNERVWDQVLEWEKEAARLEGRDEQEAVKGVSLVSFVGKPKELSPRARWKSFIGYSPPFDRHDWIVDRPLPPYPSSSPSSPSSPTSPTSLRIRYVIDFYTGRLPALLSPDAAAGVEDHFRPNLSFFIDVRPALDGWEGARMRFGRFWSWRGKEVGVQAKA